MLVAGTAAEVALQTVPDLFCTGIGIALQDLGRSHDHSRRAVAALQAMMFPESLLDGMLLAALRQALDGGDCGTVSLGRQHGARLYCLAVHQHRARAAQRSLTADVRPRKIQDVPQVVDQQQPRLNLALVRGPVHSDTDLLHCTTSFSRPRKGNIVKQAVKWSQTAFGKTQELYRVL